MQGRVLWLLFGLFPIPSPLPTRMPTCSQHFSTHVPESILPPEDSFPSFLFFFFFLALYRTEIRLWEHERHGSYVSDAYSACIHTHTPLGTCYSFFFFPSDCTVGIQNFLGQGSNPHHGSNHSHCRDDSGYFTC